MSKLDLPVVYRDEWLVAVDKPAGLLVHPQVDRVGGRACRDTCLRRVRSQTGRMVYPCHRLDQATAGVLLFAFDPETLRTVSLAFQQRRVEKRYLALCRGHFPVELVGLAQPIDGRSAETRWRILRRYLLPWQVGRYPTARYTLLEVEPVTGRRQQIRRHLKAVGHPILGDTQHGDRDHNRSAGSILGLQQMFLVSTRLGLVHPVSGQRLVLESPLPRRLQALLQQLEEFSLP